MSIFSRKKILIVAEGYGRWGNRLMLFAYSICWAKENRSIVLNPSFNEYSKYFAYFKKNVLCSVPSMCSQGNILNELIIHQFIKSFVRIPKRNGILFKYLSNTLHLSEENKNTESISFKNVLKTKNVVFLDGFIMGKRNYDLIKTNKNILVDIFKFENEIREKGDIFLNSFIESNKLLIGVCMRQGDYRSYRNGFYYLKDQQYLKVINSLGDQFANDVNFFIASEEPKKDFANQPNITVNCGSPALNLYMLSRCDYIIGPPSTFMTWASFYNDVPVCYIDSKKWESTRFEFEPTIF